MSLQVLQLRLSVLFRQPAEIFQLLSVGVIRRDSVKKEKNTVTVQLKDWRYRQVPIMV